MNTSPAKALKLHQAAGLLYNRFCAAKDMGSTGNPRKNTEDLNISTEKRNQEKLAEERCY
jgi:hypothetical protein